MLKERLRIEEADFMDFASKLMSQSRKIHKAAVSTETLELETVTKDLTFLNDRLTDLIASNTSRWKESEEEANLQTLTTRCRKLADELLEISGRITT